MGVGLGGIVNGLLALEIKGLGEGNDVLLCLAFGEIGLLLAFYEMVEGLGVGLLSLSLLRCSGKCPPAWS